MGYRHQSRRHKVTPAMIDALREIAGSPFHFCRSTYIPGRTLDALVRRGLVGVGTLRPDHLLYGIYKDHAVVMLTRAGWALLHMADDASL